MGTLCPTFDFPSVDLTAPELRSAGAPGPEDLGPRLWGPVAAAVGGDDRGWAGADGIEGLGVGGAMFVVSMLWSP